MGAKLTVQNAEIKTAAVEIRTLTISGKQVTLAVFRQLREEPLIAEDGALNGDPWGIVNYHPDKCGDGDSHIHVVWQRGPELLRARVNAPWVAGHECDAAQTFLHAAIHEGLRMHGPDSFGIKGRPTIGSPTAGRSPVVTAQFVLKGVQFRCLIGVQAARVWGSGTWDDREHDRATLAEWCADAGLTATEAAERLPTGRYQGAWRTLNELPQLFIAV